MHDVCNRCLPLFSFVGSLNFFFNPGTHCHFDSWLRGELAAYAFLGPSYWYRLESTPSETRPLPLAELRMLECILAVQDVLLADDYRDAALAVRTSSNHMPAHERRLLQSKGMDMTMHCPFYFKDTTAPRWVQWATMTTNTSSANLCVCTTWSSVPVIHKTTLVLCCLSAKFRHADYHAATARDALLLFFLAGTDTTKVCFYSAPKTADVPEPPKCHRPIVTTLTEVTTGRLLFLGFPINNLEFQDHIVLGTTRYNLVAYGMYNGGHYILRFAHYPAPTDSAYYKWYPKPYCLISRDFATYLGLHTRNRYHTSYNRWYGTHSRVPTLVSRRQCRESGLGAIPTNIVCMAPIPGMHSRNRCHTPFLPCMAPISGMINYYGTYSGNEIINHSRNRCHTQEIVC